MMDNRRMIMDASIKQCIDKNEITGVRCVAGEDQLADCKTKRGTSGYKS